MKKELKILLLLLVSATLLGSAPPVEAAIKERNLRKHVEFLAADERRGREAGASDIVAAEEYIATQFEAAGLLPLPGSLDFFARVHLYRAGSTAESSSLELKTGEEMVVARAGEDYRPFPFSDPGEVTAPVVFAGYGITAEDLEYDDYEGMDVEGKIVFLFRHEPGEKDPNSNFDGTENTQHASFVAKAQNAQKHGALGMILVTDPLHHEGPDDLRLGRALRLTPPAPRSNGAPDEADQEEEAPFLAFQVSREMAERIAKTSGKSLVELQTFIEDGGVAKSVQLKEVMATVRVDENPDAELVMGRNVVGWIEGSDPDLRDEIVVVGAHHDHVGAFHGEGDTVFNGADDNASGTSAVLELARTIARSKKRPARSIIFATFTAEEKGLLGSKALVEQNMIPVDKVVFMLNLDMIGRNPDQPVQIFGDGYVSGLKEIVEGANTKAGLELDFAGDGYAGNSDHDSFYRRDIPFLFPFTGLHEDYHQLGDHVDKLSYDRMTQIASLAEGIIVSIADAPEPPRFIHHVSWLGIQIEPDDESARITSVQEDSRAEAAGFLVGDVITGINEDGVEEPTKIGEMFRAIEPGTATKMKVLGESGVRLLDVVRARRGYLGVFPGGPSEEQRSAAGLTPGNGVLIRQVVDDGPAMTSGIQEGDILLQIAGRPVGTRNLGAILSQIGAGETVDVLLYRDEERTHLELTLGERPRRR